MKDQIEAEINQVKKQLIITQVVGAPGIMLVGLGLYGIFTADGNAFHPWLNAPENCYFLLGMGGVIAVWEVIRVFMLAKRQRQLMHELTSQ